MDNRVIVALLDIVPQHLSEDARRAAKALARLAYDRNGCAVPRSSRKQMRFGIRASNFSRAGCALVAAVAALSSHAWADGGERGFLFQFAPTSFHYHDSPDYKGNPWLVGVEYSRNDDWLVGYSYFNNSFDQKSHYAYGGRSWKIGTSESPSSYWYLKATGGVIVGYRDPYEDKIPFNHNGIAPGIVFGVGYRYGAFNAQVNVLGTSGLMVTFGYALPQ